MRNSMGVALLAVCALVCALGIEAAPPQQGRGGQPANPDAGLPWAYGFGTPVPPPAGARGGGGAPAAAPAPAPAEEPEDMEAPRKAAGSTLTFNLKEVGSNQAPADWFPQDHPAMPEIVAHGDKAEMVNACGFCHYPNGKGRPNNAGPAGLPAEYILQQIQDFKDGARSSYDKRKRNTGQMIAIAQGLSPEEAQTAAAYFSSMKWTPYVKVVETDTVPKTRFVGGGGGLCMPLTGAEAGMEPLGNRIIETPVSPEETEPLRNPRSGFIAYVPPGSLKRGEDSGPARRGRQNRGLRRLPWRRTQGARELPLPRGPFAELSGPATPGLQTLHPRWSRRAVDAAGGGEPERGRHSGDRGLRRFS